MESEKNRKPSQNVRNENQWAPKVRRALGSSSSLHIHIPGSNSVYCNCVGNTLNLSLSTCPRCRNTVLKKHSGINRWIFKSHHSLTHCSHPLSTETKLEVAFLKWNQTSLGIHYNFTARQDEMVLFVLFLTGM